MSAPEQQPTDEEIVQTLYIFAGDTITKDTSPRQMTESLLQDDLDDTRARDVIAGLSRMGEHVNRQRKAARRQVALGIAGLTVGLSTAAGVSMAWTEAAYVVASGVLIVGPLFIMRGLSRYRQQRLTA